MKRLKITIQIGSPILQPKYPINLDGLLYWAFKANSDLDDNAILAKIDTVLDKDPDSGIYKASSLRFVRSKDYPVEAIEWAMATRTHWEDWHFPRAEKKATIITKSGGFRKRVTTHKGIKAGFVEFNAVGDADKIEYLLNSLGFIGLNNSQGFGEIQDIQISEIENDYSFFDENNELARNLPVSMVEDKGYLSVKNSVKPPYQNSERIDSFIPNFRLKNI